MSTKYSYEIVDIISNFVHTFLDSNTFQTVPKIKLTSHYYSFIYYSIQSFYTQFVICITHESFPNFYKPYVINFIHVFDY